MDSKGPLWNKYSLQLDGRVVVWEDKVGVVSLAKQQVTDQGHEKWYRIHKFEHLGSVSNPSLDIEQLYSSEQLRNQVLDGFAPSYVDPEIAALQQNNWYPLPPQWYAENIQRCRQWTLAKEKPTTQHKQLLALEQPSQNEGLPLNVPQEMDQKLLYNQIDGNLPLQIPPTEQYEDNLTNQAHNLTDQAQDASLQVCNEHKQQQEQQWVQIICEKQEEQHNNSDDVTHRVKDAGRLRLRDSASSTTLQDKLEPFKFSNLHMLAVAADTVQNKDNKRKAREEEDGNNKYANHPVLIDGRIYPFRWLLDPNDLRTGSYDWAAYADVDLPVQRIVDEIQYEEGVRFLVKFEGFEFTNLDQLSVQDLHEAPEVLEEWRTFGKKELKEYRRRHKNVCL
eukprot:TRINITY_DN10624_c0_g3_i2.p1 TRINITY_DN10624_c0_g3~~TRINITY_DN10624_c0_g3_i2.p1  ORF type:complete len:392 (+),score=57.87 TRINITY_DN10624_c0_g3_i2:108-1283(+)